MPIHIELDVAGFQICSCLLAIWIAIYGTQRHWWFSSVLLTVQTATTVLVYVCLGIWFGQEFLLMKSALLNVGLIASCVGLVLLLAPYARDADQLLKINERNGYRVID